MTMTETTIAALEARGLDVELADRMGFASVRRAGTEWLEIPCLKDGRVWRRKYRTLTGKKQFSQEGDGPIPWNVDVLLDTSLKGMPLVITEGELDALAAIQCGFPRTISVPDGAPQEASAEPFAEKRYAWVENLRIHLGRHEISEIILATDGDGPGLALMQDLSAMLGRFRCKFLTYPMARNAEKRGRDRLKDLNEVLLDYGQQGVVETINRAAFVQSEGVYRFEELPELPPSVSYAAGFGLFDQNYRVRMGDFCVITGIPSHGKSAFANDFFCRLAMAHGLRIAWASFENHPIRDHRRLLRTWYAEMPEREMSLDDTALADGWIDRQHRVIVPPEDSDVSLEWMLETMEQAVVQHDCQVIVIDPWNEMDHMRERNETETEYVGRAIKAFKRFARAFQIHLVIIAHPTKIRRDENGRTPMPSLYDIAGCYSDDTEVLTKRGWLRHGDMTLADDVACFDLDGAMTYAKPSRIIRKPYSGLMERFTGYGYDLLVTPDHRMVVSPEWPEPKGTQRETGIGRPVRWNKGEWSFCEAADLPSAPFSIPLAAPLRDGAEAQVGPALSALAGWYVSEGSKVSSGVSIAQAVGPRSDQIAALLALLSIPFTVRVSAPGGKGGTKPISNFYIGVRGAREVVAWLHAEAGIGSANKRIPGQILRGTREDKLAFLDTYLAGDGTPRKNGFAANTISARLRDDLQRLCLELGFPCSWSTLRRAPGHSQCWQINVGHDDRRRTALRTARNRSREAYSGEVWCLTVPTGAYFVRRNGRAVACGNSAHWNNKADIGIIVHRETEDETVIKVAKSRYHREIGRPGSVAMHFSTADLHYRETERLA